MKERIAEMREAGMSMREISAELGISLGSVRNALAQPNDKCLWCGKKLVHVPGKKKKRFCGDSCRTKWWNDQKRKAKE